jgi:signal transduction histidine kinase
MRRIILPRHFILSVLLLLALVSVYIFFEARRLQGELLRQTEAKGLALADVIETNIRSSVLGNSLLEELISQRLLDNARLIDQLLRFPPVDRSFLQEIAALNGLRKIDLLDPNGRPLGPELPARSGPPMQEMMARMKNFHPEESPEQRQAMMTFMWGRRWRLPQERSQPPPKIAEKKFWEGSVFGVAVGARSFSGIIAVHADADYIVNFRKEIDLQKQIDELGRQPDIEHVVLLDSSLKVLAHTDPRLINQQRENSLLAQIKADGEMARKIVHESDGRDHYDVVKPVTVNGAKFGFLEIGLSLQPMQAAWHRTLRSMLVFGFAVLAVGISGMGVIFYNQQSHLRRVRSLEAEISRKERLSELGNLAATVAHEIRNPLNSVSIGLQRLMGEFSPTQDQDEYAHFLNLMQDEVRRINGIVEQFLSLARPLNLNRENIAVGDFLQEVAALMTGDANSSNVRIELKVAPNLPLLHADRNFLKQLLLNLILNGIQAMPRGGDLTVEADADKDFLRLSVSDTGMGIAAQTLEKIFEPYFTTKTTGSGLGLAISRRIVEAHGGTIAVHSESQRGSRFLVRLPFLTSEARDV